jgi:hypothetical protein
MSGTAAATNDARIAGAASATRADYLRLPLAFEANRGQQPAAVRFLAHAGSSALFLTPRAAALALPHEGRLPAGTLRMTFPGASPAKLAGLQRLPGTVTYLSRAHRVAGAPTFGRVAYRNLWNGVNAVFHGSEQRLEYDFVVAPRADPGQLRLRFPGIRHARIADNGDLLLTLAGGRVVRELAPVAYQAAGEHRTPVTSHYVLNADGDVRIAVGSYDRGRTLIIDPVLTYGTYLGGTGGTSTAEAANAIAVDASGNAYVTGATSTTSFSGTGSGAQPTNAGGAGDVFVTKLNPSGTAALYSTYLGGTGDDRGLGIAIDAAGSAVVTGLSSSTNFPTTAGAPQTTYGGGGSDAFVTKLTPDGTGLVYSTYLGGSGPTTGLNERGTGVVLDAAGNAYVTGWTFDGFPTTPGAYQSTGSSAGESTFVAKLTSAGALSYSTLLIRGALAFGIAVNAAGNAYVTGYASNTVGTTFPTTTGAYQTANAGIGNIFVTEFTPDGSGLVYSTLLGTNFGQGYAIALDGAGRAYVTGTASGNSAYPTTPDALRPTSDRSAGVLSVLSPNGSALAYSTFLGGTTATDTPQALAVDDAGNAYVAGLAGSTDIPTTPGALRTTRTGTRDGFLSVLQPGASSYAYSSYTGVAVYGLARNAGGSVFVTGLSTAAGLATAGALRTTNAPQFVARYDALLPTTPPPAPPALTVDPASAIGDNGATLSGTVNPKGSATTFVFEYGTSVSFGSISTPTAAGAASAATPVAVTVSGLLADTTYYYRLVATNAGGTSFGAIRTLRTTGSPPRPPAVTTLAASAVTNTGATLSGQVNPNGQATAYTFEYGTSIGFGAISSVVAVDDAYAVEPASATLTGLQPDTTYYVRIVATNGTGTTAGAVTSFNTGPGGSPVIATGAASGVSATSATLAGTVNPHGAQTAFTFAYGTSAAHLDAITTVDNAGSTQGPQAVSLPVTGLQPGTTYAYRLVATNSSGTALGTVRSFVTTPAAP